MRQTLLVIPREIAGIDVFGLGWLLAIWAIVSLPIIAWSIWRYGWGPQTRSQLSALAVIGVAIAVVLPALMEPQGLLIRGYGTMLLLAVISGVGLSVWRAYQKGVDPQIILSLATWLFVAGIVGARLFYVIEYWDKFQKARLVESLVAMVNLTQGGLVVFGSMLAGGAALVAFVHRYNLPGLALADLIAPGVVLGAAVGRIGCLLNGCCYGGISEVPWALQFPPGSPAYVDQAQRGELFVHGLLFKGSGSNPPVVEAVESGSPAEREGIQAGDRVAAVGGVAVSSVEEAQFELLGTFGTGNKVAIQLAGDARPRSWTIEGPAPRSRPVHPTQLYSLIDGLLLCFLLLAYEPYRRRDGELTALVLMIHPVLRFLLEIVRVDESPVFHTGLSISQNLSIGIFVAGVCLWIYLHRRRPLGCQWPAQLAVAG